MLETILQSINSNLGRIAKALEMENAETVAEIVHDTAEQFKRPQIPAQPLPQQPIATGMPQASTTQAVVQNTIPTAQMQESFTQEQLAVAMSRAVSAGKMNVIQGILQQLNVQALTQINPADYNKVATMLKEAGVEI